MRLRQVLEGFGRASTLARSIGRSEGAVRKWLRGQSEPNVTDLRALGEVTRTRIEWLVTGRGPREEHSAAREVTLPYGDPRHPPLELGLLETVVTAVETQVRATGTVISPVKRATLIAACYDIAQENGLIDPQAVTRLVKLAG